MKVVNQSIMLEFVRNMDYSLGRAFAIVWGQEELDTDPKSEINKLIVDALQWRPAQLNQVLRPILKRKLAMLASEFPDDPFLLLNCLLEASAGDYSLLNTYAKANKILPSKEAYSIYFDVEEPADA